MASAGDVLPRSSNALSFLSSRGGMGGGGCAGVSPSLSINSRGGKSKSPIEPYDALESTTPSNLSWNHCTASSLLILWEKPTLPCRTFLRATRAPALVRQT